MQGAADAGRGTNPDLTKNEAYKYAALEIFIPQRVIQPNCSKTMSQAYSILQNGGNN